MRISFCVLSFYLIIYVLIRYLHFGIEIKTSIFTSFPRIIPEVLGVYMATLLSKILVTGFIVNFLELEEPSIYGYDYAPRYISELVANQGNSVKTLQ